MTGIVSYGAYVPLYRLSRDEIARAWSQGSMGGEKAIANYDEDSITMAVAAALDCLNGMNRESIDGLYFATTTAPYKEKLCAVTVAAATDLRREVFSADFTNSLRAGTTAIKAAIDAIGAGSAKKVLVTASDYRLGAQSSEFEQIFGDGAAAFIIGDSDAVATIEGSYSHADELIGLWRTEDDRFIKSWEDRFVLTEGYVLNIKEAIAGITKKHNLTPKDFAKVIFYAPDARRHTEIARSLGLDKTQVQDPMFNTMGNTGSAFALMMLVAALDEAKPGERILFVNYGDGCDAFILKVTEKIEKHRKHQGVKGYLSSRKTLPNYETYMRYRKLVSLEAQRRPAWFSSPTVLWRDREKIISLHASKCKKCGRLFFPPQRVCNYCWAKDEFEYVRISDRKGTLFTFCQDNLALSEDPPTIVSKVCLDGPVGFYCLMTDREPDEVKIDMPVELTFRKIHDGGGYPNYFWKCMPVRRDK